MRYFLILIAMPFLQMLVAAVCREFSIPLPYFYKTYCVILMQQITALLIPLLLLYRKKAIPSKQEFSFSNWKEILRFFLLGVCMQMIGTALNLPISILFQKFGYSLPSSFPVANSWFRFLVQTVVVCLTPAVLEEILFRNIIFHHIRKLGTSVSAMWISALLFSMAHFDFFNLVATVFIGIILGYFRKNGIALIYCMITHFSVNFTASCLNLGMKQPVFTDFFDKYLPLVVFLSLVIFFAILPSQKEAVSTEPRGSYVKRLLRNPLFYCYILTFVILGVRSL